MSPKKVNSVSLTKVENPGNGDLIFTITLKNLDIYEIDGKFVREAQMFLRDPKLSNKILGLAILAEGIEESHKKRGLRDLPGLEEKPFDMRSATVDEVWPNGLPSDAELADVMAKIDEREKIKELEEKRDVGEDQRPSSEGGCVVADAKQPD